MNGPIKDFMTSRCNFFTPLPIVITILTKTKLTYFDYGDASESNGMFQFSYLSIPQVDGIIFFLFFGEIRDKQSHITG